MGELGNVLEHFFGLADPFRSVRATIRQWKSPDLTEQVESKASRQWGRKKGGPVASESPRIVEEFLSVWVADPSRVRIEERKTANLTEEPSIKIVNGECWTTRDAEGHVEFGSRKAGKGPALTDIERHFDPALIRQFFMELAMEAHGFVHTASRECVLLHALLRSGRSLWPHWLPKNADEYEFHADRERGVLLALLSKFQGHVFAGSEVVDIHFDETLKDDLFSYTSRLGEQVHPPVPIVERLSLASAMAQMPFTVFIPARKPGSEQGWLEIMHHPARLRSPRAFLTLAYVGGIESGLLLIHEVQVRIPNWKSTSGNFFPAMASLCGFPIRVPAVGHESWR